MSGSGGDERIVAAAAAGWRLERRADGVVDFVAVDDTRREDVDLRRAFPLSAPRGGVAVIAAGGGELAWLDDLDSAGPALAALVGRVLAEREFVPVVERIESLTEGRPSAWSVLTDRGPHRVSVAHADDIVRQPDGALSVTDAEGIRYRIVPAALDPRSRRLLDRFA